MTRDVKNWSVTFPQSGELEKEKFHTFFPPSKRTYCARESHADGSPHLHIGVYLVKGLTKPKMLEWIKKKFPDDYKRIDVQPMKKGKYWENYCNKEDPETYYTGDREEINSETFIQKWNREILEKEREEVQKNYQSWLKTKIPRRCAVERARIEQLRVRAQL